MPKSLIRRLDSAAIDSQRGMSSTHNVENAQAVFARFWASPSDSVGIASEDIAVIRGTWC